MAAVGREKMKFDTNHETPRVHIADVPYTEKVVCHKAAFPPPSSRLHIVVDVSLLHLNWCVIITLGCQSNSPSVQ